jgi:hypothetical protein
VVVHSNRHIYLNNDLPFAQDAKFTSIVNCKLYSGLDYLVSGRCPSSDILRIIYRHHYN